MLYEVITIGSHDKIILEMSSESGRIETEKASQAYTIGEEIANSITHGIGAALSPKNGLVFGLKPLVPDSQMLLSIGF